MTEPTKPKPFLTPKEVIGWIEDYAKWGNGASLDEVYFAYKRVLDALVTAEKRADDTKAEDEYTKKMIRCATDCVMCGGSGSVLYGNIENALAECCPCDCHLDSRTRCETIDDMGGQITDLKSKLAEAEQERNKARKAEDQAHCLFDITKADKASFERTERMQTEINDLQGFKEHVLLTTRGTPTPGHLDNLIAMQARAVSFLKAGDREYRNEGDLFAGWVIDLTQEVELKRATRKALLREKDKAQDEVNKYRELRECRFCETTPELAKVYIELLPEMWQEWQELVTREALLEAEVKRYQSMVDHHVGIVAQAEDDRDEAIAESERLRLGGEKLLLRVLLGEDIPERHRGAVGIARLLSRLRGVEVSQEMGQRWWNEFACVEGKTDDR